MNKKLFTIIIFHLCAFKQELFAVPPVIRVSSIVEDAQRESFCKKNLKTEHDIINAIFKNSPSKYTLKHRLTGAGNLEVFVTDYCENNCCCEYEGVFVVPGYVLEIIFGNSKKWGLNDFQKSVDEFLKKYVSVSRFIKLCKLNSTLIVTGIKKQSGHNLIVIRFFPSFCGINNSNYFIKKFPVKKYLELCDLVYSNHEDSLANKRSTMKSINEKIINLWSSNLSTIPFFGAKIAKKMFNKYLQQKIDEFVKIFNDHRLTEMLHEYDR